MAIRLTTVKSQVELILTSFAKLGLKRLDEGVFIYVLLFKLTDQLLVMLIFLLAHEGFFVLGDAGDLSTFLVLFALAGCFVGFRVLVVVVNDGDEGVTFGDFLLSNWLEEVLLLFGKFARICKCGLHLLYSRVFQI